MYIFLPVFSVYHDTGDDKTRKALHTIASASRVLLIYMLLLVTFIQSIFLPLSEFHIALDVEAHSVQPVQIDVSWL